MVSQNNCLAQSEKVFVGPSHSSGTFFLRLDCFGHWVPGNLQCSLWRWIVVYSQVVKHYALVDKPTFKGIGEAESV